MNVGAAGGRLGIGGGRFEPTGSFGRRKSMLKAHEVERAEKDELVITNIPLFRYLVAFTFQQLELLLQQLKNCIHGLLYFWLFALQDSLWYFCSVGQKFLSLKNSTKTIIQSKYLFCKRVRHLEFKIGLGLSIRKFEQCCKLAFVLQLISDSRSVKILRTRLPWEQDTNHMLIKHFMAQKGKNSPEAIAEEAQIKVEFADMHS